jgi:ABC-2 type transport system ATP-binding protein
MISIDHISKSFRGASDHFWKPKQLVLNDINLQIAPDQIIGFLGANGAGKTTLIKIILGLISQDSGTIRFEKSLGKDIEEAFRNLSYLPERPYFYPHLTGREFAQLIGITCGISKATIYERLKTYASMVKIEFALDRKLKSYSKGMLQRVGLMVCLITRPKLLILDEPLSGVDPVGRKEIKDIIVDFQKNGGTVFFSSHILADVEEICDQVVFMKHGTIQLNDKLGNILSRYQTNNFNITYQASECLLDSVNLKKDIYRLVVDESKKEQLLRQILDNAGQILSVEREKKSLEEVLYVENK